MTARALDLFAGAGGWDIACSAIGIAVDGVENMPAALETRQAAGLSTVHDDVWTMPAGLGNGYDGLIASPPCQTFSKAGKGDGRQALENVVAALRGGDWNTMGHLRKLAERVGDERTALVLFPLHYAATYPFRWLAWEQVPSVLPVWEACAAVLRALGWRAWTGSVTAEQYGVPQTRRRAVLLASRTHLVGPPPATHSKFNNRNPDKLDKGMPRWVSMAQALGWGVERLPHKDAVLCPTNLRPNACLRPLHHPAPTMAFGHEVPRWVTPEELAAYRARVAAEVAPRVNNQSGVDFDLAWPADRPAPTVAGRELVTMPGANANRFNGRQKSRNDGIKVTVPEAGVLQDFPPDYPWGGSKTRQYLQVGNAVPPGLAVALLRVAAGIGRPVQQPHRDRYAPDDVPLFSGDYSLRRSV